MNSEVLSPRNVFILIISIFHDTALMEFFLYQNGCEISHTYYTAHLDSRKRTADPLRDKSRELFFNFYLLSCSVYTSVTIISHAINY
jgi:hypothetical protein